MGYIEGLLGGFVDRKREYEAEQMDMAAKRSDRESRIYQTLLSSPDPEIQSLAATGLLDSARGPMKKGGLAGWLGQMEESTILPQIQQLIRTPVLGQEEVPGPSTLPSKSLTGYLATPPPVTGSLAQSTGSQTEGDTMAPLKADETVTPDVDRTPPSALIARDQPSYPTTIRRPVLKPRQVFMSPEESMLHMTAAREEGEIEGPRSAYRKAFIAQGMDPQAADRKALDLAIAERQRRGGGAGGADRSIFGEILQPDGKWVSGSVVFDPQSGRHFDTQTGQPVLGFRRNTVTGSASAPTDARRIMQQLYPGKQLSELTADEMAQVNAEVAKYGGVKAGATTAGRMDAAAAGPLDVGARTTQTNTLVKQWTEATASSREVNVQWNMMQNAFSRYDADPNGVSQAILVTFQKILDENSVVRESEYARSAYGLSLLDWLKGMRDRYAGGGAGVPKPVLAEMIKTASTFVTARNIASGLENIRGRINAQAIASEIQPELVFGQDPYAGIRMTSPAGGDPQVGVRPPGAQAAPAAPAQGMPTTHPHGATKLDSPAPGIYMDAEGKLIYK